MLNAITTEWEVNDDGEPTNGLDLACPNSEAAHEDSDKEEERCLCCANDTGYVEPIYNYIYPVSILDGMDDHGYPEKIQRAQIKIAKSSNVVLLQNPQTGEWFFALTSCGQDMTPELLWAHVILRQIIFEGSEDKTGYLIPLDVAEHIRPDHISPLYADRELCIKSLLYTLKQGRGRLAARYNEIQAFAKATKD